ncbi:hypothetical protein TU94_09385 [Streptomyces cyaneogriseus subsp. noncyanogenus]|uniref:Uncharacterized protein n=1 Tax=Streptomyces cyaneogriseus subsp. noncyanogenus TaxID=477245 RepID=A0A0C5FZ82_9ACTN|nr:hypothetical protein [Streptomyces cyaneogriseus]AJP01690.1 hypothetical protein TU94_09385 [Streptomyces cyaneogriseus subsp. noncyanogenus]
MTHDETPAPAPADDEGGLESLRGDGARMARHWAVPERSPSPPASPALPHGVSVPPSSARLLDALSEYGD